MARLYPNEKSGPPRYSSPIPGVDGLCGSSYYDEVEVRVPYGGIDKYANRLPAYALEIFLARKPDNMEDPEFKQQLDYTLQLEVLNKIEDLIDDAADLRSAYAGDGLIDQKNNAAIGKLLNEARDHLKKAKKLKSHWSKAWISSDLPKGWPLENQWYNDKCENRFAPDTFEIFTMTPQGAQTSEQVCPEESIYRDHQADRLLYVDLVRSALLKARCAQEAAAAVGTYHRNKREYEKGMKSSAATRLQMQGGSSSEPLEPSIDASGLIGRVPGGAEPPPAGEDGTDDGFPFPGFPGEPPDMGGGLEGDDDEGLPEPDDEGVTGADEDSATSKPKKSKKKSGGSGLLIAGAAVLGLLAFGGKK